MTVAAARSFTSRFAFAITYAVLAFLAAAAFAQDAPLVVEVFHPPSPGEYVMGGALAMFLIGACVRALREVFTDLLAPVPSTKRSKGLVLLLCVVLGSLLGLIGVGVPIIAGKLGYVIGGVGLGIVTYLGAKAVPEKGRLDDKGRVGARAREATGLTPAGGTAPVAPPEA